MYERAIEKESARAMHSLAQLYEKYYFDGEDVVTNGGYEKVGPTFYKIRALRLCKNAIDLDYKEANNTLDQLYENLTLNFQEGSELDFTLNFQDGPEFETRMEKYKKFERYRGLSHISLKLFRLNNQAGLLTSYFVQGVS